MMKELEAITDYTQVSEAQLRKTFRSQGYLFIKGFFPSEDVRALRKTVTDVLVRRGWGRFSGEALIPSEPFHKSRSEEFYACHTDLISKEDLHLWAYRDDLTSLLEGLLGEEIFAHPRKSIRISYPREANTNEYLPAHQDGYYIRGEVDTFVVWTPLGNYSPTQGGLEVAHDSHRSGFYTLGRTIEGRPDGLYPDVDESAFDWRIGNYEVGDLVIMHGLLLHKSLPNLGKKFRLSWDCRFSSKTGHINSDVLLPPLHPYLPEWEELTKGWSQPNLFSLPETLHVDSPLDSLLHMINQLSESEHSADHGGNATQGSSS
jgi:Phytanoyl-CoA dioxygenase (PhyH)